MKKIMMILSTTMLLASSVMAESHGGVMSANAQMKAVAAYATSNGGALFRVLNIKKHNGSNLFTISYGGMNSAGKESVEGKEVVSAQDDQYPDPVNGESSVIVTHVSGWDLSN